MTQADNIQAEKLLRRKINTKKINKQYLDFEYNFVLQTGMNVEHKIILFNQVYFNI